jgi:RNA polymerase-binding transcription factor DksA
MAKKQQKKAPKAASKASKPVKKAQVKVKPKAPAKKVAKSAKASSAPKKTAKAAKPPSKTPSKPKATKPQPGQPQAKTPLLERITPPTSLKVKPEIPPSIPAEKLKLTPAFLETQKSRLLELRDHILDQMQEVAHESLRSDNGSDNASAHGLHQADAGSDAYERDFALSLLSQEQDALYEIEEALKRIENRTYGICEISGQGIPKARLEAIPFARYTVEQQAIIEKENRARNRWNTAPQFMESAENFFEEEDESSDEEEKSRLKE